MDEATLMEALRRHWDNAATDQEITHEIYHDDAVLEFPQSRERFVGKENLKAWRKIYPASLEFKIRRIRGEAICGLRRSLSNTTADPGSSVAASCSSEMKRLRGKRSTSLKDGRLPNGVHLGALSGQTTRARTRHSRPNKRCRGTPTSRCP
jgi:hypothetical protein